MIGLLWKDNVLDESTRQHGVPCSATNSAKYACRTDEISDDSETTYVETEGDFSNLPSRTIRLLADLQTGEDPIVALGDAADLFDSQLIEFGGLPFTSVCPHHFLPFWGEVSIALVASRVVGFSRMERVVRAHAARAQLQEELTAAIAAQLLSRLNADGVRVEIQAIHACMALFGRPTLVRTTSALGTAPLWPAR